MIQNILKDKSTQLFIVLFIAFKIGNGWSWKLVIAICIVNYTYKFVMAIVLTPLIYLIEGWIEKYVGHETAHRMKLGAMGQESEAFANIPTAG